MNASSQSSDPSDPLQSLYGSPLDDRGVEPDYPANEWPTSPPPSPTQPAPASGTASPIVDAVIQGLQQWQASQQNQRKHKPSKDLAPRPAAQPPAPKDRTNVWRTVWLAIVMAFAIPTAIVAATQLGLLGFSISLAAILGIIFVIFTTTRPPEQS
ncbi:MAG: hypothetical protein LBM23_03640 [Propionibacteriaceae bacterium]|jgi:hypothetical protein|nr:hypothetical protein [Propionibacteriaceae bacterium]